MLRHHERIGKNTKREGLIIGKGSRIEIEWDGEGKLSCVNQMTLSLYTTLCIKCFVYGLDTYNTISKQQ